MNGETVVVDLSAVVAIFKAEAGNVQLAEQNNVLQKTDHVGRHMARGGDRLRTRIAWREKPISFKWPATSASNSVPFTSEQANLAFAAF